MKSQINPSRELVRTVLLRHSTSGRNAGYLIEIMVLLTGSVPSYGVATRHGPWQRLNTTTPPKQWHQSLAAADAEFEQRWRGKEKRGYKVASADTTFPVVAADPAPAAMPVGHDSDLQARMQACYREMGERSAVTSGFFT